MSSSVQPEGPPSPVAPGVLPADSVVGERYRVRRMIGEGGMGAIYLAEHVELETPVALKILSTTRHTDAESVERFMREARAAVKIGHRNIVRIFDLGWLDEITPYMAMEFLAGQDLDQLLVDEGWVPTERALSWMAQVGSAIDAVHREGLVHRDIKPANIYLSEEHGEVIPKLLDFGLAQLRDKDAQKRLTRDGLIVGTPHYIAPEVGLGNDPDEMSDLYSFAVVTYESLCGRLPFDHDNPTALMLEKVQNDPPPLRRTQEGPVSPEVEAVFQKALNREPMLRHESCTQFVEELEAAFAASAAEAPATAVDQVDTEPPPRPDAAERAQRADTITDTALVAAGLQSKGTGRRPAMIAALLLLLAGATIGVLVWAPWTNGAVASSDVSNDETEATEPTEVEEPEETATEVEEPEGITETEPVEADPVIAEATDTETDVSMRRRRGRSTMASEAVTSAMGDSTATMESVEATMATSEMAEAAEATMAPEQTELEREAERTRARELTQQAQTKLIRGQLADAARLFQQATYHDARHAPAWRGLGISQERLGHRPEARRAYQRYLRLAGGAGDAAAIRRRMEALGD